MDAPSLAHEREQIDLGACTAADPDHRDPPADRQRREIVAEVRCADQLEHDVEGPARRKLLGWRNRDRAARGSDLRDAVAQRRVSHSRHDARAGGRCQLYGGNPDTASGSVHEHALAQRQAALREHRVVRGGEHLGEPAGFRPRQAIGYGERDAFVHRRELGLATPAHDGHHSVTDREARHACADCGDGPGELHAGDVGRRSRRSRVQPSALHHVGAVEPGGTHGDEQLAVARDRVGVLAPFEPTIDDRHCVHDAEASERRDRR